MGHFVLIFYIFLKNNEPIAVGQISNFRFVSLSACTLWFSCNPSPDDIKIDQDSNNLEHVVRLEAGRLVSWLPVFASPEVIYIFSGTGRHLLVDRRKSKKLNTFYSSHEVGLPLQFNAIFSVINRISENPFFFIYYYRMTYVRPEIWIIIFIWLDTNTIACHSLLLRTVDWIKVMDSHAYIKTEILWTDFR